MNNWRRGVTGKRRTKIVATIGPAVASESKLAQLCAAGLNVARINCSHGNWQDRARAIDTLRRLSAEISPIGILADLQGPKLRIGEVPGGAAILKTGSTALIGVGEDAAIRIMDPPIYDAMAVGDRVLLGDGEVELKLTASGDGAFEAKVVAGGRIKSRQGITLVGKSFEVSALDADDREDVYEACKHGVDFIALSYVRHASDMRELRRLVDEYDPRVKLCAKIETREALKELDEIIKVSDLIMIARGDLGLQVELEDVPLIQKRIIQKCALAAKPVITATQMLESMVHSPRPTRAEATDVANAILDGTDAVMLSGETAMGDYPVEAVKTMSRIAEKAETEFDHGRRIELCKCDAKSSAEAVAQAAVQIAHSLRASAILTTTTSGQTPRLVSRYRPSVPIYCTCWTEKVDEQMSALWGVESLLLVLAKDTDEAVHHSIDAFHKRKKLKLGDKVVVTAGAPPGVPGHTNMIMVETVK